MDNTTLTDPQQKALNTLRQVGGTVTETRQYMVKETTGYASNFSYVGYNAQRDSKGVNGGALKALVKKRLVSYKAVWTGPEGNTVPAPKTPDTEWAGYSYKATWTLRK